MDDDLALVICSFSSSELTSAIAAMPLEPFSQDWSWLRGLEKSEIPLKMERIITSSVAKAKGHRIELGEAKHRPNEGVVHPLKAGGSGELLAKDVTAEGFHRFKETLNKCLKKTSVEIC